MYKKGKYDVILTDIRMPEKDGIELLREIKSQDPGQIVVMHTAYSDFENVQNSLRGNADDFISKTSNYSELNYRLEEILTKKEQREAYEKLEIEKSVEQGKRKALEQLITIFRHEIITPLNGMDGAFQLIDPSLEEDEFKEYIEIGKESAKKLNYIIDRVALYASLNHDNLNLSEFEYYSSLEKHVLDIKEELQKYRGDEIELIYQPPSGKQVQLYADEELIMKEVLGELIINAARASEKGKIFITSNEEKGIIKESVTDYGMGIEKKYWEDVFLLGVTAKNPSYHSSIEKHLYESGKGGPAFGLAIADKIVKLHKGKIWFDSQYGQVTTFSFTLPKKTLI